LNFPTLGQSLLQDFIKKSSLFFANERKKAPFKLFAQTACARDKFIKMH
jgi:hypothetical protein